MAKRNIEREIEALKSLRQGEAGETTVLALRQALSDRVNLIAAKAASVTADLRLQALIPELLKAFERFLENGAETDPKCWGKEAIVKALIDLGYSDSAAFLRGLRHIQMEPVWGKHVDTAARLRATCALALLQCADLMREEKIWHLMRALTDAEAPVRRDAARALREMEGTEAALLLRLKARMGDQEPGVTGQVFESLLGVEGEEAIRFVAEFLEGEDTEVADEAALALGASRLSGGVSLLIDTWKKPQSLVGKDSVLRGISASRQEPAITFLLELIRKGNEDEAFAALQALEVHRDSTEIRKQVADAAHTREGRIRDQYMRRFPVE
jgi:HEAT repeat protein